MNTETRNVSEKIHDAGKYQLHFHYTVKNTPWRHPLAGRFDKPVERFELDAISVPVTKTLRAIVIRENIGAGAYGSTVNYQTVAEFTPAQTEQAIEHYRRLVNDL